MVEAQGRMSRSGVGVAVKRHAVPVYFALVCVISGGAVLLTVGPGGLPLNAEQFASFGPLMYVAILAGPCAGGILVTGIVDGRPGLRDLLARLRRWHAGWTWYAVALLPALVMTAMALLLALISSDFRPTILDSSDKSGILLRALGPALLVGSFEEIGWTGFAVPHLRSRHSILVTGLILGVVWGAWHFPLFWQPDSFSGALPLVILLTMLFSWLPPFRVLLVWLHDRTQSLPVVMLMHAAVSFVTLTVRPEGLTGTRLLTSLLVSPASMWLLLAAVGAANRWRLSHQPLRTNLV
jgi:membrane protease YdiL (CAAX protease family)